MSIALERRRRRAEEFLLEAREDRVVPVVPADVVTERWRGRTDHREAILTLVRVEPVSERLARVAGEALAAVPGANPIDAVVMASATARGDVVLTSDFDDLDRFPKPLPERAHPARLRRVSLVRGGARVRAASSTSRRPRPRRAAPRTSARLERDACETPLGRGGAARVRAASASAIQTSRSTTCVRARTMLRESVDERAARCRRAAPLRVRMVAAPARHVWSAPRTARAASRAARRATTAPRRTRSVRTASA